MDRFTFQFNGKTYVDNSPPRGAYGTGITPDAAREVSNDAGVDAPIGDTAMNVETETPTKKAPAKSKAKAKTRGATTSTKFSEYCKANKIDGGRARRALRAAGMRAPYDPASKKVLDVLAEL